MNSSSFIIKNKQQRHMAEDSLKIQGEKFLLPLKRSQEKSAMLLKKSVNNELEILFPARGVQ